jgi:hypothetical protein
VVGNPLESGVGEDNVNVGRSPLADVARFEAHAAVGTCGRLGEHGRGGVDPDGADCPQLPMQRRGQTTVAAAEVDHDGRR